MGSAQQTVAHASAGVLHGAACAQLLAVAVRLSSLQQSQAPEALQAALDLLATASTQDRAEARELLVAQGVGMDALLPEVRERIAVE